jgi:SAM-dependent methyltransferase
MVPMSWDQLPSTYDAVAEVYEATFVDELADKPEDRALLQDFADGTTGPLLDLGCGPGQVGSFVRGPGRTVVGADVSPEMARLATRRLDAAVVADMRSLPFGAATFGGVVAFYSLIHLPLEELPLAMAEIYRVLRSGGRALLSAHEGEGVFEQQGFLGEAVPFVATLLGLEDLTAATRTAGLRVTTARRRDPYASEHKTVRLYMQAERPGVADPT